MRRVVVTGLGAVSALGHDVRSLWGGVSEGRGGIGPISEIPTDRLSVRIAAEVKGFEPAAHFESRRIPMLDRATQFALVAAREAIADAGLPLDGAAARRTGVILGASIGWGSLDAAYDQFYGHSNDRLHPFTIPRIVANAPASQITMEHGLRGPCFTVASACASSTHAIGIAFHMVRSGALDRALAGGSDASIVPGVLSGWDALRVLSADTCRPFSRDRSGLVMGEGAGILVIESLDSARARGAEIYAEIVGFGMSADGKNMTAPDPEGAGAAMTAALDDAGLAPDAIDYVNAHGTGTRLNDKCEAAALLECFGERLKRLPVSSTKSMLGHAMAAAGALEMIVTCLALDRAVIPPTANFTAPDPECDLDCVPIEARRRAIGAAMSSSLAFGGLNAVLVAQRHQP